MNTGREYYNVSRASAINRPRLRRVIHGWADGTRVRMIKHEGRSRTRSCSKVSRVGRKLAVMYDGTGREKWKKGEGSGGQRQRRGEGIRG